MAGPLGGTLALLLPARIAGAAEAASADIGVGSLVQAILGLGLVLALIWGAAWLMRRVQPHGAFGGSLVKIVAAQSVGQRERVVVVEIADQWLVVGVAPGHVSALANLPKGVVPERAPTEHAFSTLLARARGASSR